MASRTYDPKLSWSYSRNNTFNSCLRRYYYQYYSRHLDPETKALVKNCDKLSTSPLAIGSITHAVFETLLRRIQIDPEGIDEVRLRDFIREKITSYATDYIIREVYLTEISQPEFIDKSSELVYQNVSTLRSSTIYVRLSSMSSSQKQKWSIENWDDSTFSIGSYKVIALKDFTYDDESKRIVIDWKTGEHWPEYTVQMKVYAYSIYHQGIPSQSIETRNYYISDIDNPVIKNPSDEDMYEAEDIIREQSEAMYSLLESIPKNLPQSIEHFTRTLEISHCRYCQYLSICYPGSSLFEIKE